MVPPTPSTTSAFTIASHMPISLFSPTPVGKIVLTLAAPPSAT
jgi:hypothetical protein